MSAPHLSGMQAAMLAGRGSAVRPLAVCRPWPSVAQPAPWKRGHQIQLLDRQPQRRLRHVAADVGAVRSRPSCATSGLGPAVVGIGLCLGSFAARRGASITSAAAASQRGSNGSEDLFAFLDRVRSQLGVARPDPALLTQLQELLDRTTAEDFGVRRGDVGREIGFQMVYEGPEMNLCVFTVPAGSKLPLHDHPGMHVFGRLLFGRLRVTSYDLKVESRKADGACVVEERGKEVFGPAPTTYNLRPDWGNLHELEALEDAAFFDVLFPPYDEHGERPCTYFALKRGKKSGNIFAVPENPWGLRISSQPYRGPSFA